jgi:hypothetical protein
MMTWNRQLGQLDNATCGKTFIFPGDFKPMISHGMPWSTGVDEMLSGWWFQT